MKIYLYIGKSNLIHKYFIIFCSAVINSSNDYVNIS